jgi:DNA repair exonuclease SbcCD ATPase subunit
MKKIVKIDTLKIENFKGIESLRIDFNGANAIIRGQNGTGKTSIVDAVCWLLANKMSDGKTGESSNLHAADKITTVEMSFTDGLTLRRECNGKSSYFVQGVPCSQKDFFKSVSAVFNNSFTTLLTPFNFCRLHYSERRNILLKLFAQNIDVEDANFEKVLKLLKVQSPEQVIKTASFNKRQLEKQAAAIPARIDELQKSIPTVDSAALEQQIASLTEQLALNSKRYDDSQVPLNIYNQYLNFDKEARQFERNLDELRANFRSNALERERLLKRYYDLAQSLTGSCPTCGSKVPAKNLEAMEAEMAAIVEQGTAINQKQAAIEKAAEAAKLKAGESRKKADELLKQCKDAENNAPNTAAVLAERDSIQSKLATAKNALAAYNRSADTQMRIDDLKAQQLSIASNISNCERYIFLAENFISRKIELTEQIINDQFELVTFKMFDSYKVSDGVKECCEPMFNGVPYASLSKGEQLKVSLDIFKTLQAAFGVELPIFIDDAESYTSNSFVNLPNQVIRLVAAEGIQHLQIEVAETSAQSNLFEGVSA